MATNLLDHKNSMIINIISFIEKHKDKTWIPPSPPPGLSPVDFTRWLFDQDDMGWLKLDIDIDLDRWKEESKLAERYYVNHRDSENYAGMKHHGWLSCCIHGIGIDRTQAEETATRDLFHWTELSDQIPVITNFWKKFPVEGYKRLRFMKLEGNGFIGVHNDLPIGVKNVSLKDLEVLKQSVAIDVAVIHPENCDFISENFGTVPWKEGNTYIINLTKNHCVSNNSNIPRVHVIAECIIGNRIKEFSELIYRSYKKQYGYN